MSNAIPRVTPRPERMKRCSGPCGEAYPIECFPVERRLPDGHRNECRACRNERRRALRTGTARRIPWQGTRVRRCWDLIAGARRDLAAARAALEQMTAHRA